ncbi:hypothetical protein BDQ17DRAFT_712636 [Cyathus striatus]|nr:hypothetical protein BDQ17DRAFT_712636 [Cyathus striatus]
MLKNQIVENMREQVEKEIVEQIDELVREHIAECLKEHIPQDLQNDVADSKRELREVRLALHNSESRRLNANLRSWSLFSLDADTVKALMGNYEIPDPSDSCDRNLNRFMQFLGVRYQLVDDLTVRFLLFPDVLTR